MNITCCLLTTVTLTSVLTTLFLAINEENDQKAAEANSFECGFSNLNDNNITFSTNFIMMVILFIIFDIEVSIIIPILIESSVVEWVMIPIEFLIILTIILFNEWNIGTLEWSN